MKLREYTLIPADVWIDLPDDVIHTEENYHLIPAAVAESHDRERELMLAVCEAADKHTKAESRLDGAKDSAYWYQKLCKALAALEAAQ